MKFSGRELCYMRWLELGIILGIFRRLRARKKYTVSRFRMVGASAEVGGRLG